MVNGGFVASSPRLWSRQTKVLLAHWVLIAAGSTALVAQSSVFSRAEEAKKLIVRITAEGIEGSGIVVDVDEQFVYAVTAKHVVLQRGKIPRGLEARMRTWNRSLPLEVLYMSPLKDLAAFKVAYRDSGFSRAQLLQALPLASLGASRRLNGESALFTIGHGAGGGWIDSREPVRLASHDVSGSREPDVLRLQHFCPGGHSGGGVFDEQWRLVGMITDNQEPFCNAIAIESVLSSVADWKLEYKLTAAPDRDGTATPSREDVVVAVVDFDNRSGRPMPDLGPAGRDIMTSFLFNVPGIVLVTRDRLDSVLREQNLAPTAGSINGASRIGKLVDARAVVTGSVNTYDVERRTFSGYGTSAMVDTYLMSLTLQVIEVETGKVKFSRTYEAQDKRTYSQASSAPEKPLQLASDLLRKALDEKAERDVEGVLRQISTGADRTFPVTITSLPEGAEVVIGNVLQGRTPVIVELATGLHEIELRKVGYQIWKRQVRVVPDMPPIEIGLVP